MCLEACNMISWTLRCGALCMLRSSTSIVNGLTSRSEHRFRSFTIVCCELQKIVTR
jgi:hypothetical protein